MGDDSETSLKASITSFADVEDNGRYILVKKSQPDDPKEELKRMRNVVRSRCDFQIVRALGAHYKAKITFLEHDVKLVKEMGDADAAGDVDSLLESADRVFLVERKSTLDQTGKNILAQVKSTRHAFLHDPVISQRPYGKKMVECVVFAEAASETAIDLLLRNGVHVLLEGNEMLLAMEIGESS